MKQVVICILFFLFNACSFAFPREDSLINLLHQAIKEAPVYDNQKKEVINRLEYALQNVAGSDTDTRYNILLQLYEEYKYFHFDSALVYANELLELARIKNDPSQLASAKLKGVFIMLSGGMFKETFDSLNVISVKNVADSVKAEYYSLLGRSYYSLSDFNDDSLHTAIYTDKANLYLDSAIALFGPNSFDNRYYSALVFLKKGKPDSAIATLKQLTEDQKLTWHQTALATSTIGGILGKQGREDEAKPYLIEASIADIKSSTKETLALLTLARMVYGEGRQEEALHYIEKANADAEFYNARLRKVQIGAVLPLIEGGMIKTIRSQKEKLEILLVSLSILVMLLATFAVIIRNQVKKLKAARASLYESNIRQQQINQELLQANELKERFNNQLQQINLQLSEANKIKEEYIGYFFSSDTQFLARIEKLMTSIDKKLIDRKYSDIQVLLKNTELKKEKEALMKNFDRVFIKLFPDFVEQFNTLFEEEDKIILKDDQLLNSELRIFALIRLGVTDNDKIAEILDYSVNTIYAKKTKVRGKTIIGKDDFEKRLIEITTLRLK